MKKPLFITESVADFLTRGGKVTKVPTKRTFKKSYKDKKEVTREDVDFSILPMSLRIRYGAR